MKPIKGFEGLYSITKDGRLYSHRRGRFLKSYLAYSKKSGLKYTENHLYKDGQLRRKGKTHRLVAETYIPNPTDLKYVDHINGNATDNRVGNLRWTDVRGNNINKGKMKGNWTSKYKGVCWDKSRKLWIVYLSIYGKTINVGRRKTEEEAAQLYDEKSKEYYGEFAKVNKDLCIMPDESGNPMGG